MNNTSLLVWWPKVKDLGIPVPKTEVVEIPYEDLVSLLDGRHLSEVDEHRIIVACSHMGFPLFLRTDMAAAKHHWRKTCYVETARELFGHITNLIDCTLAAGMFGELDPNALVFREFILLNSTFTAFDGLPIAKERRYFIADGQVSCHHPYWIESAVEGSWTKPTDPNWQSKLAELNEETPEEIKLLSLYVGLVATIMPGYWSVDFAEAKSGIWYLIDMAEGGKSFHQKGCQFSCKPPERP